MPEVLPTTQISPLPARLPRDDIAGIAMPQPALKQTNRLPHHEVINNIAGIAMPQPALKLLRSEQASKTLILRA